MKEMGVNTHRDSEYKMYKVSKIDFKIFTHQMDREKYTVCFMLYNQEFTHKKNTQ